MTSPAANAEVGFRPQHTGAGPGADCVRALLAYAPRDAGQVGLRDDFLNHLVENPGGWARGCPGAHLTASALVCSATADRVVLLRHRKLGRWLQTGGHVEASDPTLAAAALREAREESGLKDLRLLPGIVHLDCHEVPCGPVRPCLHLDVRHLIIADRVVAPPGSAESVAVRWFDSATLPTEERSVTVLVDLARARLG